MTKTDATTTKLLEIAEPICEDAGYELVDLRYVHEQAGWVVRVYLDYPPGRPGAITFEDCERVSRELSAAFDVEDPVPHAYNLEVSSPGLDRPLRTADHFRRYTGETARITMHEGQDGRRRFKGEILGVEEDADGGAPVVVVRVDGTEYRLPLGDVSTAKLCPDWAALTGSGAAGKPGKGGGANGARTA
jgi:ribosome maturation factor RimP